MLKRMLISIVAFSFLFVLYAAYVHVFGHFSQLGRIEPPVPLNGSWPEDDTGKPDPARTIARAVFGADSWQAQPENVALYWLQSGIIIYIRDYEQVSPQSLRLTPFSLLYREPSKASGAASQTVTLQGNEAMLEFDRPIDIAQMTGSKPVGGRVSGDVQIQSDRGTSDPSDDVAAYMDYLEFQESDQKIWTDSAVRIVTSDAVATGLGAELRLKPAESRRKSHAMPFEGVREFLLRREVQINMLVAGASGFMPDAGKPSGTDRPSSDTKKVPVLITCEGPFLYDLENSTARFTRNVRLNRQTAESQSDQLFCDELQAVFESQKLPDNAGPIPPKPDEPSLRFREAHATGSPVRLTSESQGTEAIGSELHHYATTGQTVLRGDPEVVASQAGSIVHSRELKLIARDGEPRAAEANGPGWMEVHDAETEEVTLRARWKEWVHVELEGELQLLVLNGAVELEQPGKGVLTADRVRVWLAHVSQPAMGAAPGVGIQGSNRVPSRIEATGHVAANSDQFNIQALERLDIVIRESSAATGEKPVPSGQKLAGTTPPRDATEKPASTNSPKSSEEASSAAPRQPEIAAAKRPPSRLRAQTIRVMAIRDSAQTELSEVWTEGNVDLLQPADESGGRATVLKGDTLHLKRTEQGSLLEVTGRPAHVEMQDLIVDGPNVAVDQPKGLAWVEGRGSMLLPSDTGFDGQKLDQPSELTIQWGSNMFFDGGVADFVGGVEARQGLNVLRCGRLEAFLTERINLADPKRKGRGGAQIGSLICTGAVQLDNIVRHEGQLEKYEHIEAREELKVSNTDGHMFAKGPGLVRTYSRGEAPVMAARPRAPAAKAADAAQRPTDDANQLYLTEIHFADWMEGNRTQRSPQFRDEIARFRDHVEVIHSPVADEKQRVDPNKLPEKAFWIACQELEAGTKEGPSGKPYYEMVGTVNVQVEARDFTGHADRIAYNQLLDRLIFESRPGSSSSLFKQPRPGEPPSETRARKIFYYRSEDKVKAEEGLMLDFREQSPNQKDKQKEPLRK